MASRAQVKDETLITLISLREAVAEYGKFMDGTRKSHNTKRAYVAALERLVEVCPRNFLASQLTPFQVSEAIKEAQRPESEESWTIRRIRNTSATRRTGRTGASLDIDHAAYRGFVDWLKAMRYLSPYATPTYHLINSDPDVARAEREAKLWAVPLDRRDDLLCEAEKIHPLVRAIVAMMILGGRRFSDLATMKVSDIDLDSEIKTFAFRNKKAGNKPVKLPMIFTDLIAEMRMWLGWLCDQEGTSEPDPDWYLFPRTRHTREFEFTPGRKMAPTWPVDVTTPVAYQTALKHIRSALRAIGAPVDTQDLGPHCLRHSCGQYLVEEMGWTEEHVSYWLDHKDVRTTAIYTRGANRVKLLNQLYAQGPAPTRENPKKPSVMHGRSSRLKSMESERRAELHLVA